MGKVGIRMTYSNVAWTSWKVIVDAIRYEVIYLVGELPA